MTLDPADVEAVARRVVELLREGGVATRLLTAEEVAARLGVDRAYVYAHASELGVRRLGDGPRARLRFDATEVDRRLNPGEGRRGSDASASPAATRSRRRQSRPLSGQNVPLLPVKRPKGTT